MRSGGGLTAADCARGTSASGDDVIMSSDDGSGDSSGDSSGDGSGDSRGDSSGDSTGDDTRALATASAASPRA